MPAEDAGGELAEFPAAGVFHAVVVAAEGAEVVGLGDAAVLPWVGVVEVAAAGGVRQPGARQVRSRAVTSAATVGVGRRRVVPW